MRIESNGVRRVPAVVGRSTRQAPAHWELGNTTKPDAAVKAIRALTVELKRQNELLTELLLTIRDIFGGGE